VKVAIYCRVSKEEQNPENQKVELLNYVRNHPELELYKVYEDKISGVKDSRPELDRLMQDARKHLFNHVVIWSVDRLGRSPAHFFQIVEEWSKLGISFSITTLGIDTSTPVGKFITGILSQVAELERQFTIDRINLSLKRIKREIETKGYYISKSGRKITKLGRPKGRKDSKPRRKSGYYQRWAESSAVATRNSIRMVHNSKITSKKTSPHFSTLLSKERT
jgi:DNA invertase Pin-like site-specific DNA recombinase